MWLWILLIFLFAILSVVFQIWLWQSCQDVHATYTSLSYDDWKRVNASRLYRSRMLLEKVVSVLEAHHITYWVHAGTLLGTCRHGEMIPWNDDIDLCIYQTDAQQLQRIFHQNGMTDTRFMFFGLKVFDAPDSWNEWWSADGQIFIDLFCFHEQDGELLGTRRACACFPQQWYDMKDVFPLVRRPFFDLAVYTPHSPLPFLHQSYGPDCMTVGKLNKLHVTGWHSWWCQCLFRMSGFMGHVIPLPSSPHHV